MHAGSVLPGLTWPLAVASVLYPLWWGCRLLTQWVYHPAQQGLDRGPLAAAALAATAVWLLLP